MAPSRNAAQLMLRICEKFTEQKNIKFSTDPDPSRSKSKAIYVVKRAQFIDSSVKIREGFGFAHPGDQITVVEKYCTAAYGSNLWKLGEREAVMYTNAWRTSQKLAWDVPRACHSYLVQTVLAPHVGSLRESLLHREV